jgi:hypothetical protein
VFHHPYEHLCLVGPDGVEQTFSNMRVTDDKVNSLGGAKTKTRSATAVRKVWTKSGFVTTRTLHERDYLLRVGHLIEVRSNLSL